MAFIMRKRCKLRQFVYPRITKELQELVEKCSCMPGQNGIWKCCFYGERKTGHQRMIKHTEVLCSTQVVRFDFKHACAWLLGEHILTCNPTECSFHFQLHLSLSLFAPLTSVNEYLSLLRMWRSADGTVSTALLQKRSKGH